MGEDILQCMIKINKINRIYRLFRHALRREKRWDGLYIQLDSVGKDFVVNLYVHSFNCRPKAHFNSVIKHVPVL